VYGQHSREILSQHGFTSAEIEALIESGAVVAA
jgi:crotonobetainyl-CoA:carnitine CoA-transferase CaiB-like acyl-CoA transferase